MRKEPYTEVQLENGLRLKITHPEQSWAFPFVIKHENEYNIRLSLSRPDAIKVLRALMETYPLDAIAGL